MLDALLQLLAPPRCLACRAPGADLCARCRRALPFLAEPCVRPAGQALDAAYAVAAHGGAARALVVTLKYRDGRRAAREMAAQLAAVLPPAERDGAVLVAAPGHPRRVARRGYDQAVVLAQALARRTGMPLAQPLRRGGPAVRQVGGSRADRLQPGRIVVTATAAAPARVVLVDDVRTTGATLDACARALRAAGAQRVIAVTYARA